mmetsp:Transcript_65800/g.208249  ORF Transcript_65800/g.208249 Transcript_65800/m.208249 type:complete len:359 (-) Transcript_65800:43-1119(-)|eukprot:CAMPEP_0182895752 /NCGR_PEP_ID=MMETSP0034_2-20130328/25873_1 /TAXON_ID=156128 /ORGANISM="Nephroselmis pyriformis, Strain CCMP717" /LENGTH=358 /DNA_ID=CAMNT_0025029593 /DNA_START=37 /DNA_END=1113 /DNA_ORIENTATION=-
MVMRATLNLMAQMQARACRAAAGRSAAVYPRHEGVDSSTGLVGASFASLGMLSGSRALALKTRGVSPARAKTEDAVASVEAGAEEDIEQSVNGDIYDNAEVYDIAFGYRDFKQEVDFLFNLTEERLDEEPMSALELGAGPARHSIELAKRGLQVTALELNPHMVEYAQGRAAAEKVSVNFIEGDMRGFQVPQPGGGFDMVLILLGSLNHLLDNQAVVDCFKSAAAVLSPKGTMVVEVGHPQDLWDGQVMQELGDAWENEQDGSTVLVEWGREGDGFDPVTQVLARTVGLTRFNDADEIVSVTQTTVPQRLFSAQELDALARASGLKVDAMYGDMNQDVDIYHDEALRMVLVMSRDEGA